MGQDMVTQVATSKSCNPSDEDFHGSASSDGGDPWREPNVVTYPIDGYGRRGDSPSRLCAGGAYLIGLPTWETVPSPRRCLTGKARGTRLTCFLAAVLDERKETPARSCDGSRSTAAGRAQNLQQGYGRSMHTAGLPCESRYPIETRSGGPPRPRGSAGLRPASGGSAPS